MTTSENTTQRKIDYLDEDPIIHGQEWICVSFLSPEGVKNCKLRGFKFRGAFGTRQEAEAHAKEIQQKLDPDFHVYVGEGFKWLPWDQDPETIENQEYAEKELNELMKANKEQLLLKKQHENERRKRDLEMAMQKKGQQTNKTKERLQQKHMKKYGSVNNEVQEKETPKPEEVQPTAEAPITPIDKDVLQKEIDALTEKEKTVETEKQSINELNEHMKKLQVAYDKLLAKKKEKKN